MNYKSFVNTKEKKILLENFTSLSALQGVNCLLPLVTLPYLVRVLGLEKFGLVAFAQAFIQYFVILTDYGFNLSATREISIHRENKKKVSEIFSSVMIIKLGLLIISFLILTALIFTIPKFKNDWLIYIFTFGMVIGNMLFPIWFFQGMEKMKYITFLNIIAKSIFTISIFVFIRNASHYIYVPAINSLGFLIAGVLSLWIVFRDFEVNFHIPNSKSVIYQLKKSFQFFLSRASVSVYTLSNTFFLGLFTNNIITGYYAAADKLYRGVQGMYQPVSNTLYPYISKSKNKSIYKKIFKLTVLINILVCGLIFIFNHQIVNVLYGQGFVPTANVLRIFSGVLLVVAPSVLLGYPFLAALGYAKYANTSVIIGSILHLIGLIIISSFINIYLVVFLTLFTESLVFFIRVYGVKKHKLWEVQ